MSTDDKVEKILAEMAAIQDDDSEWTPEEIAAMEAAAERSRRAANKLKPRRLPSNDELLELAKRHPPAPEWYEGEEEKPF